MKRGFPVCAAAGVIVIAVTASASGETPGAFRYEPADGIGIEPPPEVAPAEVAPMEPAASAVRLEFAAGIAFDLSEDVIGIGQFTWRTPIADTLSVGLFAEGYYAAQDPDDAFGFGGGLSLRWVFSRVDDSEFFIDAGCGAAVFTDDVPAGGSTFNFTPRALVGFTAPLDARTRIFAAGGWFHISNAQTGGENPGIDALAIFAGLSLAY